MGTDTARVVVIEDERLLREAMVRALSDEGLATSEFEDCLPVDGVLSQAPDLAVIDVMLPHGDGFELARRIRDQRDIPIIFVTARDSIGDRLAGFELGADDYLTKPFAMEELLARVRAVLRRTGRISAALQLGSLLVDEAAGAAYRDGQDLELTPTELRLLAFFVRHRGLVMSKPQLLTQVWGYDAFDPNLVEVHVSALRRKLERHGKRVIETVHGLGYRLAKP